MHEPQPEWPDEARLVNCASCEREILGAQSKHELRRRGYATDAFPSERGKIKGRPYCDSCLRVSR